MKKIKYKGMKISIHPCMVQPDTHTYIRCFAKTKAEMQRFANLALGATYSIRMFTIHNRDGSSRRVLFGYDCKQRFSNNSDLGKRLIKKGII